MPLSARNDALGSYQLRHFSAGSEACHPSLGKPIHEPHEKLFFSCRRRYPDLVSIGNSTINLNGQALEVIVIIMSVYLFLNLVISVVMNSINRIVIRGSR